MTSNEKEEIRQKILNDLEVVKMDIEDLEELTKPIPPDNAIGRLTRMDAINNRSVNEAMLNSARVKLRQLESMLSNIDKPGFGKCVICDELIPTERLKLVPESDRCVKCAS